jgi:hypothetical protein
MRRSYWPRAILLGNNAYVGLMSSRLDLYMMQFLHNQEDNLKNDLLNIFTTKDI